ncbi:MAG: elongation factor P hydroxylase [Marinobacterium sp.]|nr:elongation factor P hydroxylase [Marinobacterium sp.]
MTDYPTPASAPQAHDAEDLITLFDRLFRDSENTILVRGDDEPIYLPADAQHPHHRVIFAHGFFASVMHEVAHWCVAGPQRRLLEDFGYWYKPDGRSAAEQAEFEKVEIRPQAMEWHFCACAGYRFVFSADNLSAGIGASEQFRHNVQTQALEFVETGLPPRAQRWCDGLRALYGVAPLTAADFSLQGR